MIRFQNVVKILGGRPVLDNVSFEIGDGEVFVIVGPSGVGKSVTLKHMVRLLTPDEGRVFVKGEDVSSAGGSSLERIRDRFGYLFQGGALLAWMTVSENVALPLQEKTDMPADDINKRVEEVLKLVGLEKDADKQPSEISGGMRKRAGLARAIVRSPEIVLYDEPTSGLDPLGRRLVRDIIRRLKAEGTTVFLNSHFLSEVEITCDRVAFIKAGQVVHLDTMANLLSQATEVVLRVDTLTPELRTGLEQLGTAVQVNGARVSMMVDNQELLPQIAQLIFQHGIQLYELSPRQKSLEEIFMDIIEGRR